MPQIQTLEQAFSFVMEKKVCLIFGSKKSNLPSLWDAVDLPERIPGQKGWGQKIEAIWAWKNQLPAEFPDEIFYGKLPGGLATLMCLKYLHEVHFPAHHRVISQCSPLARRAYDWIRREPHTTAELRAAMSPAGTIRKSQIDAALIELQVTLNIARTNSPEIKKDTWLPFSEQYPSVVLES